MVFVDTSAWYASLVPSDPLHEVVLRALNDAGDLRITTDYCADETLTLLTARNRPRRALEFGTELFERRLARLEFVQPDDVYRAWILFRARASSGLSFTDCVTKIGMDRLGIHAIIALDDHFRTFATLTVLP